MPRKKMVVVLLLVGVCAWLCGSAAAEPPAEARGATGAADTPSARRLLPATTATAYLANVPPEWALLAPELIHSDPVRAKFSTSDIVRKMDREMRGKLLADPRKYLVAHAVARPESGCLAISVRGIKQRDQAGDLARALAEAYSASIRRQQREQSHLRTKALNEERTQLMAELQKVHREIADARTGSPLAAMGEEKSLVSIRLAILTQMTAEEDIAQAAAAAVVKEHPEELKNGSIARSPLVQQAVEADPAFQRWSSLLAAKEMELLERQRDLGEEDAAVAELAKQVEFLTRQTEARRAGLTQAKVEAIGQQRAAAHAAATRRLADLKERLGRATAEARDVEHVLGRIRALTEAQRRISEALREAERSLLELRLEASAPQGAPALLGVVSAEN